MNKKQNIKYFSAGLTYNETWIETKGCDTNNQFWFSVFIYRCLETVDTKSAEVYLGRLVLRHHKNTGEFLSGNSSQTVVNSLYTKKYKKEEKSCW